MTLIELKEILQEFQNIFHRLIKPNDTSSQLNLFADYAEQRLEAAIELLDHPTLPPATVLHDMRTQLALIETESKKYGLKLDKLEIPTNQYQLMNLSYLHELLDPQKSYAFEVIADLKIQTIQRQQEAGIKAALEARSNARLLGNPPATGDKNKTQTQALPTSPKPNK